MHGIIRLIFDAQNGDAISPRQFAEALELDLGELERCAGVESKTALLNPESETLQDYMRASLLVILTIAKETLDPEKAMFYFKYLPVDELAYKTPQMLVSEGRAIEVLLHMSR